MMRKFVFIIFIAVALFSTQTLQAQFDSINTFKTYHVGIFAPLYLDSVFSTDGNFRFRQGIPKFITPGTEFVHGAEIALDSMSLWNANVKASIFDSKSNSSSVHSLIKDKKLDSLDLIIGSVKDVEYKQLADFALEKNIPFISATYPNDGGITNDPFVVIINSTLKAHCEAIYSYILQNHGTDKIFLCRKKGTQEDKVAAYFKTINEPDSKPLLNIQVLNFDSTVSQDFLKSKLDSNRQSIIIGGSLDEEFANSLTSVCYILHEEYPITLIGMPNWDGFKALAKKDEFEDFPVFFTSPYFNNKWDIYSRMVINGYTKKYKGNPTDMAFKGFECTWLFTKLLIKYPVDIMSNLNDKTFKVFSEYNFRPVALKKNGRPDYFENKHLYFMKIQNGTISRAW